MEYDKIEIASRQRFDGQRVFADAPLAPCRALVLVHDPLERDGVCVLLAAWGCDTVGVSNMQDVARTSMPAPDFIVVGASDATSEVQAQYIESLRTHYAVDVPAVVIGEARAVPVKRCTLLSPLFTPQQLGEAVVSLLAVASDNGYCGEPGT